MPIVRSYFCENCATQIEVTLDSSQWDDPAPDCPTCTGIELKQEFRPIALGGSPSGKAHAIAEDILANDYHVADTTRAKHEGDTPKVRYKDSPISLPASTWSGVSQAAMEQAMNAGRQTRLKWGNGLDVLQANIKSGAEPDLIANSRRKAIRIY
jgi:hypothetical protein